MHERILIAGHGGQGVMLIGKLIAVAAMKAVPHVTFFPSYTVEVRGGTSYCQLVLSSAEISSPIPEQFDTMIIMNQPSTAKFLSMAAPDSLILLNSTMCGAPEKLRAVNIPANEIANEIGDIRAANFVMLGAYANLRKTVPGLEAAISEFLAGKDASLIDLDVRAFRKGLELAARAKT